MPLGTIFEGLLEISFLFFLDSVIRISKKGRIIILLICRMLIGMDSVSF